METTWTTVGKKALDRAFPGDRKQTQHACIDRAVENLTWESVGGSKPMMPALGIIEVIRQLELPKVSLIAISHDLAPYGFYGVEAHYGNGRARVYVMDCGDMLVPLRSDFYPGE